MNTRATPTDPTARLAELEQQVADGAAVDPAEFVEVAQRAGHFQRFTELTRAAVTKRSESLARRRRDDEIAAAKAAAAAVMAPYPAELNRLQDDAVRALRALADGVDLHSHAIKDAVAALEVAAVPHRIDPEPVAGLNAAVDPAVHARFAVGDYSRPSGLMVGGRVHRAVAPAEALRSAVWEAAQLPAGRSMQLPSGVSIETILGGRRERPEW